MTVVFPGPIVHPLSGSPPGVIVVVDGPIEKSGGGTSATASASREETVVDPEPVENPLDPLDLSPHQPPPYERRSQEHSATGFLRNDVV